MSGWRRVAGWWWMVRALQVRVLEQDRELTLARVAIDEARAETRRVQADAVHRIAAAIERVSAENVALRVECANWQLVAAGDAQRAQVAERETQRERQLGNAAWQRLAVERRAREEGLPDAG